MTDVCMAPEGCDQKATVYVRGTVLLESEEHGTIPAPVRAVMCGDHIQAVRDAMCLAEGYPYTAGNIQ